MITNISDACERIHYQFGMEARHNPPTLELLQAGQPYTPANIADIETAVSAWRDFSITVSGQTVTVTADAQPSIDLIIGDEIYNLELTDGAGSVTMIFPDGVTSRNVSAAQQTIYGYRSVTVNA